MDATQKASKVLKDLRFDFATFTVDGFLSAVGQSRGREIITIPWDMPPTLFGAWVSDGDEPKEYIFYRNNVPVTHQIHIQLHEISHFLLDHPTLKITQELIGEVVAGTASFPFGEKTCLRSPQTVDLENEAEALASMIQKRVIQNSKIGLLVDDTSAKEKLADFLKKMGAA